MRNPALLFIGTLLALLIIWQTLDRGYETVMCYYRSTGGFHLLANGGAVWEACVCRYALFPFCF